MAPLPKLRTVIEADNRWVVLRQDGIVEEWVGENLPSNFEIPDDPIRRLPLGSRKDIVLIAASFNHSTALTSSGSLLTWRGYQQLSQTKNESKLIKETPSPPNIVAIASGGWSDLLLDDQGRVFYREVRTLDLNRDDTLELNPLQSCLPLASRISSFESENRILAKDGSLWLYNDSILSSSDPSKPLQFNREPGPKFIEIAQGESFVYGLTKTGDVYSKGDHNDYGQLSLSYKTPTVPSKSFTKIPSLKEIVKIACSPIGVGLALGADGRFWTWGLGLSTTPTPTSIDPKYIPLLLNNSPAQVPSSQHMERVFRYLESRPLTL